MTSRVLGLQSQTPIPSSLCLVHIDPSPPQSPDPPCQRGGKGAADGRWPDSALLQLPRGGERRGEETIAWLRRRWWRIGGGTRGGREGDKETGREGVRVCSAPPLQWAGAGKGRTTDGRTDGQTTTGAGRGGQAGERTTDQSLGPSNISASAPLSTQGRKEGASE